MKDRERGVKCRKVKYRKKHKIRELESQTDRQTDRQRGMEIQNARTEREREGEREREKTIQAIHCSICAIVLFDDSRKEFLIFRKKKS